MSHCGLINSHGTADGHRRCDGYDKKLIHIIIAQNIFCNIYEL